MEVLTIKENCFQDGVTWRADHLEYEQMTSHTAQQCGICNKEYNVEGREEEKMKVGRKS